LVIAFAFLKAIITGPARKAIISGLSSASVKPRIFW
jgi:hypothetical protein